MFCSNCGKKIGAGIKFCPYCGASTEQGSATGPASVEASPANNSFRIDKKKKKRPKWIIIIAVIMVMVLMIKALSGGNHDNAESDNTATEETQNIELTEEIKVDNAEEVSNISKENSSEFDEAVDDNSAHVEDPTYYGGGYEGSTYYIEVTMFTSMESDCYGTVSYFDNEGNENLYYLYSDYDAYNDWGYEYDYLFTFNDKDDVIFYLGMKNTSNGVTMDLMTLRATMDTLTMIWHRDPVEPYEISELDFDSSASHKLSPEIGMTKDEVLNSAWGSPDNKSTSSYSWGTREQWCYKSKGYVYFENGIVDCISTYE